MKECGSQMTELELRGLLGCFLFSGDDADKKIKILSGGEKARVALAKTIVSKANFLMLDEPTNHLDMHSCDLLIDALKKYAGSIILVSHDRYFISKTANKIWEIIDYEIKEFKGGYEEWAEWKERMAARKSGVESRESGTKKQQPVKEQKPVITAGTSINKEVQKELQKQQRIFQQAEKLLSELNQKKTEVESKLSNPATYSNAEEFKKTEAEYQKVQSDIKAANATYEKAFELVMKLEEELK